MTLIAIFTAIPSGSLCGGESSNDGKRSLLSFVDIYFPFAVFFFSYKVKLTFVLDDAPSSFHVTRD